MDFELVVPESDLRKRLSPRALRVSDVTSQDFPVDLFEIDRVNKVIKLKDGWKFDYASLDLTP